MTSDVSVTTREQVAHLAHVRGGRDALNIALVAAFATLPAVAGFGEPLNTLDEALLMVYPEQILTGDVPNADFFTSYGPGGLTLLAGVFSLVGPSVLAERIVGLAYHMAIGDRTPAPPKSRITLELASAV